MSASSALAVSSEDAEAQPDNRPVARGKFFFRGTEKFFLKCVSYGPFAPAEPPAHFFVAGVPGRSF